MHYKGRLLQTLVWSMNAIEFSDWKIFKVFFHIYGMTELVSFLLKLIDPRKKSKGLPNVICLTITFTFSHPYLPMCESMSH